MKNNIEAPGFVLPGIEDITRRDFLVGGAAALLLGGCGSSGGEDSSSGETRQFEHAMGATEVPVRPKRLAALADTLVTLPLLDIGYSPFASAGLDGGIRAADYDVSEVEFLGDENAPNIERVAALEPDLIVGMEPAHGEQYERLSQIAPTVMFGYDPEENPFEYHRKIADLVGYLPEYKELVDRVDSRTEELRGRLDPIASELEVSVLAAEGSNELFHFSAPNTTYIVAFEMLGLRLPASMPPPAEEVENHSLERLPDFDADVLFFMSGTFLNELRELQDQPIFGTLNAAEKEQVFTVSYDDWTYSRVGGILAVYDDVERYLVEREIDTSGDFR
jgi:iron complex transport system substrate-binding protein